jgi:hypothetical protein
LLRTSLTVSSSCGASTLKSFASRASRQRASARAKAFAMRAISDCGVAIAWSWSRRISRRFAACQPASDCAFASARSSSREIRGETRSACDSISSAASWSPRTSALARGIVTAASHLRTASTPRKAWSLRNSCSSC